MKKTFSILALLTLVSFSSSAQLWIFPERNRKAPQADTVVVADTVRSVAGTCVEPAGDSVKIESVIPERIEIALELPLNNLSGGSDDNLFEFYCGALLAAKDLGESGIKVDLKVKDTNSGAGFRSSRSGTHAIIGPISSKAILKSVSEERESSVWFVSPLDPKAEALVDSFRVIQTPTPLSVQAKTLVDWLSSELMPEDRVLVVSQSGETPDEFSRCVLDELSLRGIGYKTLTYNILEALEIPEKYVEQASVTGITRVFAASASESFCGDVLRNVNLLQYKERKGILYCNSRLRSIQGIEIENLHSAMTRMVANYNVDYSSPKISRFVMEYRALFNCEPNSFAFQGYDVLHYICTAVSRLGTLWYEKLPEYSESGLQSDFIFDSAVNSGRVNKGVRKLVYNPDYSISIQ